MFFIHRFLLRDYMCIGVNNQGIAVVTHCGESRVRQWAYDPKTRLLKEMSKGRCVSVAEINGSFRAKVVKCDTKDEKQLWDITFYKKSGLKFNELV